MNQPARALIRWTRPDEGGRQTPPGGPTYLPTARFEEDLGSREQRSVALKLMRSVKPERFCLAEIRFLSDAAPTELLRAGSRFELMEGPRRVAKGIVLASTVDVPEHLTEFETALIG